MSTISSLTPPFAFFTSAHRVDNFLTNDSDKLTPFTLLTLEWLAKHDNDDVRSLAGGIPPLMCRTTDQIFNLARLPF